jgi:predicted nucleotidyltransferase
MISLIKKNKVALERLCHQYHVRRLELFGSALTDERFDGDRSDLDFLVEFFPLEPGQRADTYFGLLEGLEALFQRRVDLVVMRAIKNPYFRQAIDGGRELLYVA